MPDVSGLVVAGTSRHRGIRADFVILTMYDDEIYLRKALELGALGYLPRDNAESELISSVDIPNASRLRGSFVRH